MYHLINIGSPMICDGIRFLSILSPSLGDRIHTTSQLGLRSYTCTIANHERFLITCFTTYFINKTSIISVKFIILSRNTHLLQDVSKLTAW